LKTNLSFDLDQWFPTFFARVRTRPRRKKRKLLYPFLYLGAIQIIRDILGGNRQCVTQTFFAFLKHRFNAFGSMKSSLTARFGFKMYNLMNTFHISKHTSD